jgi:multidrug efflux pump subunit AcrA (membrane-fusion protein)
MKPRVYLLILILVLFSLIGYRLVQKRAGYEAQVAQRAARMKAPPVVSVSRARVQDVASVFEAVGSVEAPLSVKIAAKVTGRIGFLQSHEGDPIRQGQVLVRIDPTEVEANLRQQKAGLAEAQYRLAQAAITQNANNVSVASELRQQEAALASAQADYDQASENYRAQVDSADAAVSNFDAGVRSAQANLANARARFNRSENLYKQGFIAAQDVDDARTVVGVQEAAVDAVMAQRRAAQKQAEIVRRKGKADIDAARARVTQARAALDYAKANTAQKSAYQESLAALRSTVAAAEAGVKAAEARRADMVLTAPFGGFVTGRFLDPGAVVTAGQPILAVQSMRQVWVTVAVPEEVSGTISLGVPARVTLDALPGRRFTGKVTQVNASADPMSRQFSVRVTLDNPDNVIKPGTFAHVAIETHRVRGAIVVPREAVQRGQDGSFVMVVDNSSVVRRRPVTLGTSGTDVIAITEGIRPGEKVITLSAYPVKDGQTVSAGKRGARTGPGRRSRPSRT